MAGEGSTQGPRFGSTCARRVPGTVESSNNRRGDSHGPWDMVLATGDGPWPTLAPGRGRKLGTGFNPHLSHSKGRGEDRLHEDRQAHARHPMAKLHLLSDLRSFHF